MSVGEVIFENRPAIIIIIIISINITVTAGNVKVQYLHAAYIESGTLIC